LWVESSAPRRDRWVSLCPRAAGASAVDRRVLRREELRDAEAVILDLMLDMVGSAVEQTLWGCDWIIEGIESCDAVYVGLLIVWVVEGEICEDIVV
jgi:hypothetical protein